MGTTWDLVGQCIAPFSPGDVTKHPHGPSLVNRLSRDERDRSPRRFTRIRRLAPHGGRNVAPPGVSLPGPFVTAITGPHWLRTLQSKFEQRFLYGNGPAQVGFGLLKEPHRLKKRLSAIHLRLTLTPETNETEKKCKQTLEGCP
jgi:hypothetical protein